MLFNFIFNPLKYGYSNARVMAMKSLLIPRKELENFLSYDIFSIIEQLRKTHYKEYITKYSLKYHGSRLIQIASAYHFVDVYNKIRNIAPKDDKEIIDLFMLKWGLTNLRLTINAKIIGRRYEDFETYLLPLNFLNKEKIKEIFGYEYERFIRFLINSQIIRELLKYNLIEEKEINKLLRKPDRESLIEFENYLTTIKSKIYDKISKKRDLQKLAKIGEFEEEIENILLALNKKETSRKYLYLLKMNEEEIISYEAKKHKLGDVKTAKELEMKLYNKLSKMKGHFFYLSYHSLYILLGFLFLKEDEITNLKRIAIGKEFDLSKEEIEKMLVI